MKLIPPLFYIVALLAFANYSYAEEAIPTCKDYGCPDCSCVASHPDIKNKIPKTLTDIKNILILNGIPPEAVEISVEGYEGEEKRDITKLIEEPKEEVACCCGCGAPNCKWTFGKEPITE